MSILSPAQKKEYEKIRRERGAAAADKWKQNIIDSGKAAGPNAPKNEPAPPTPAPAPVAPSTPVAPAPTEGKLLSPEQRNQYEKIKKEKGKEAAEKWKQNIVDSGKAAGPGATAPITSQPTSAPPVPVQSPNPGSNGNLPPLPNLTVTPQPTKEQTEAAQKTAFDWQSAEQFFNRFLNFGDIPELQNKFLDQDKALLEQMQKASDPNSATFAGRRSADIQDILGRMKGGLDGYTAAENNALREAMNRNIDSDTLTQVNRIRDSNARNLVFGGAAAAREDNARRAADRQKAVNEQDLFIKNVDEKYRRLGDYAGMTTDAEKNEYERAQKAAQDYTNKFKDSRDTDLGIQKTNAENLATNNATRAAGIAGFADIMGQTQNQAQQNQWLKDWLSKITK